MNEADIEALLEPIPGDTPVGPDPREDVSVDSLYLQLKDARSEARDAERRASADGETEPDSEALAHWSRIIELSQKLLTGQAKDLEVASWLIEGLLRREGFAGLAAGFRLANGLVERFWDAGLYPVEDEDGVETRVAPLMGLNGADGPGALIRPINLVPLTDATDPGPFAHWQYQQALEISRIPDPEKASARVEAGGVTLEAFTTSVRKSSGAFLSATYGAASAALEAFTALAETMRGKAGDDAPPSSNIRDELDGVVRCLRTLAPQVVESDDAAEAAGEAGEETMAAGGGSAGGVSGALAGREDALRQLTKVADFFHRTEPHSPLSMTLHEAVRRARLTLPELLAELLPEEEARESFLLRAGIRPPQISGEGE